MTDKNEAAPVFSTWKKVYAFVLGFLIVLIISFYLFTKAFE
jgi:hypothetical protein